MDLQPEVTVPICIEQGSVYHFRLEEHINRDGTRYSGNRFFIVLNVNPKTDEILILTTITTKIAKTEEYIKRVHEDPETLVKITSSDFARLASDSVVNCNSVYPMTQEDLIAKLKQDGGVVFFERLPKSTIEALVRGVLKSTQVSNEYKKLLV